MSEGIPEEEKGHTRFEEIDEGEASKILEGDEVVTPEEQEVLVSAISDPKLAFEVWALNDGKNKFTPEQIEKLMNLIESDEELVYSLHLNFVESGIILEPTETEQKLLNRLEKVLAKTENPDLAAYVLEHARSLTDEERGELKERVGL